MRAAFGKIGTQLQNLFGILDFCLIWPFPSSLTVRGMCNKAKKPKRQMLSNPSARAFKPSCPLLWLSKASCGSAIFSYLMGAGSKTSQACYQVPPWLTMDPFGNLWLGDAYACSNEARAKLGAWAILWASQLKRQSAAWWEQGCWHMLLVLEA